MANSFQIGVRSSESLILVSNSLTIPVLLASTARWIRFPVSSLTLVVSFNSRLLAKNRHTSSHPFYIPTSKHLIASLLTSSASYIQITFRASGLLECTAVQIALCCLEFDFEGSTFLARSLFMVSMSSKSTAVWKMVSSPEALVSWRLTEGCQMIVEMSCGSCASMASCRIFLPVFLSRVLRLRLSTVRRSLALSMLPFLISLISCSIGLSLDIRIINYNRKEIVSGLVWFNQHGILAAMTLYHIYHKMKWIISLFLVACVLCSFGVDMSTLTTLDNLKCLRQQYSVNFLVMRAYRSYGSIDPNAKAMIQLARDAGIDFVDVYFFPCPTKDPETQAQEMLTELSNSTYNNIWVDVEDNYNPQCNWTKLTSEQSCAYIQKVVNYFIKHDKIVGIYASKYMWTKIMGSPNACSKFMDLPIWYPHYDGQQNFDDFLPFGGWSMPTYKQYKGTTTICNAEVDFNWYPMCKGGDCQETQ